MAEPTSAHAIYLANRTAKQTGVVVTFSIRGVYFFPQRPKLVFVDWFPGNVRKNQ